MLAVAVLMMAVLAMHAPAPDASAGRSGPAISADLGSPRSEALSPHRDPDPCGDATVCHHAAAGCPPALDEPRRGTLDMPVIALADSPHPVTRPVGDLATVRRRASGCRAVGLATAALAVTRI